MGVGISAFVLSLMVVVMIIPTVHSDTESQGYKTPPSPNYSNIDDDRHLSYEEKLQKELDRLLVEYELKEPDEGGPYDEILVDFQQTRLNEIQSLEESLLELDKVIDIKTVDVQVQKDVIVQEQKIVFTAKEQLRNDWNAPPVVTVNLDMAVEKLKIIDIELDELIEQKRLVVIQIDTKKLLYEIQKHDAKLIGIELSANCIAMAKLNSEVSQYENDLSDEQWDAELEKIKQTSSCPTYEDLYTMDNSITSISGEFSFHDGYFHREKTGYQDSYRAYDNDDKIRILVDPPQNEGVRIKMITIVPNFGYYADNSFATTVVDGKRMLGNERIINNCFTAQISADNLKMLLPDTIFTFRNGCESAEISDRVEFDMPKTEIDIWTSPNLAYSEWLLDMKILCKVKC